MFCTRWTTLPTLHPPGRPPPPQPAARAAPAAGAAFAMPAGGVPDPNLAALTCALVLVLVVGFSALNAALVSGVLYLALSAVRREGGARGAARAVAQRVAELSLRVGLTPAQFGFLLIAAAVLVWNLLLRGGSSSSYGGSSSYAAPQPCHQPPPCEAASECM